MATKSKKRNSVARSFQQAQRAFEKKQFKQALKGAKLCYRQQPSQQHRVFLERAHLARGRELRRCGLRDAARAVVQGLLDLGVTDSSVQDELPELLLALGMFDQRGKRQPPPEFPADSSFFFKAADHAVLRPQETPSSLPEICRGALQVRAALEALEEGNDDRIGTLLKDLPRSSPFADWKYFVRGLAAYYQRDGEEIQANWSRLDPDRFAARIAGSLTALIEDEVEDSRFSGPTNRLQEEVLGTPILSRLNYLQAHVAAGRWKEALRELKRSAKTFCRFDPALPERIVAILYPMIVRSGDRRRLSQLASAVSPPAMDPGWNRAWALVCEHSESLDADEVESYWLKYLDDLAELPCLTPTERTLAQALVWRRIGEMFQHECEMGSRPFGLPEQYVEHMRARTVECFANSVRLAPDRLPAWEALTGAYCAQGNHEQAAETRRELLKRFPEHLDSLLWLARHHVEHDEPIAAREYADRARRLKPLDKTIEELVWAIHVDSARHQALAKRFEAGRAEFEAAEQLIPEHPDQHALLVGKALLEFKAGNVTLGHRYLDQARSRLDEPTPALLILAVESVRFGLPKQFVADFDHQWMTALKTKCHSQTAGEMSRTLDAYLDKAVDYPSRPDHVEQLLAYVRRCSRVKWKADDLRNVCVFLDTIAWDDDVKEHHDCGEEAKELLHRLLRKGHKRFRKSPFFQFMAARAEFDKGPARCDFRRLNRCLRQAVKLAASSPDPRDAALAEDAKRMQTFFDHLEDMHRLGFPMPPPDFSEEEDEPSFHNQAGPLPDEILPMLAEKILAVCAAMGIDPEGVLPPGVEMEPEERGRERRSKGKRKKE